ncbi:hypothetical protein [Fervidicoccus fontis]|uniref:Uncharacterized protein n=1 Tax=Fervidicoccus fontis (strain DSM 19380 / JCM 18336 / VKM B-2539 / Kam940) TaxID=1163730 RepID=H9ZZC3_FERFK|nr:hypothetical protein [Fervidicoccus fontis]AFH42080.1 hypothetical protein FFONT_0087 [Fervidicoccus fontis Kam940]
MSQEGEGIPEEKGERRSRKGKERGISEIVSVMALLLIAVVAVFALRGWLSTQQSRMTNIDMATASYSVQTTFSGYVISLDVRNNLQGNLAVNQVQVILSNGTALSFSATGITPALPNTISAKSDQIYVITVNAGSGVAVKQINVRVQEPISLQSQWITAIGGG